MVVRITIATNIFAQWMEDFAAPFEEAMDGKVKVDFVVYEENGGFGQLYETILSTAQSRNNLFSAFITPPIPMGDIVELDGWADLTDFIRDGRLTDFVDILPAYREYIASYESEILSYPLDGDIFSYYYNKAVLQEFNLTVPKTWEEYNEVARATHGKVFENKTLSGSCIGRMQGCAGAYWANAVIAPMTQTRGPATGSLFDTKNMAPVSSQILEKALGLMQESAKYGAPGEFEGCIFEVNIAALNDGTCTHTIDWGDQFKYYLQSGSTLRGRLGVAQAPGSHFVLDRDTNKIRECTKELCPYAEVHKGKLLNRAPYLAFGGWSCAVSNFTDDLSKEYAMKFCAFASSAKQSNDLVIPNATTVEGDNGQDPYRFSQLNVKAWVAQGYEEEQAQQYLDVQEEGLSSPNAVIDTRFPTSPAIYDVLDKETFTYLNKTQVGLVPIAAQASARAQVAQNILQSWDRIITNYNEKPTTSTSILEIYQRLRGVYVPNIELNQLGQIRIFGYTLWALVLFFSVSFAAWAFYNRKVRVVRASQPLFLMTICAGCSILSSAIYPLGIDDGTASVEACTRACQALPWLLAIGFTIIFSALYSKIRRVNIVVHHAKSFRKVEVREKDVLVPFGVLLGLNLILLVSWQVTDPLYWDRRAVIGTGGLSSYGTCAASGSAWLPLLILLVVVNGAALFLANCEAYKGRKVSVEYRESKWVGMAMVSVTQVFVVGIPLLFLTYENPDAAYVVQCSIVFVVSGAVLAFIFVPKLKVWLKSGKAATTTGAVGLAFAVHTSESRVKDSKDSFEEKISRLEDLMKEKGIETGPLFEQAGFYDASSQLPTRIPR